jgi:Domain of unknown function (DUF4124)
MRRGLTRAVAVALLLVAGDAAAQPYRYVDEQGQVHYVARRDQVPERYRGQLGPARPGEPAKPLLTPNPGGRAGAPRGCILRLRGTERKRGSSHSYANCDACRKALQGLSAEEASRAECFASSVEDELGKRSR